MSFSDSLVLSFPSPSAFFYTTLLPTSLFIPFHIPPSYNIYPVTTFSKATPSSSFFIFLSSFSRTFHSVQEKMKLE